MLTNKNSTYLQCRVLEVDSHWTHVEMYSVPLTLNFYCRLLHKVYEAVAQCWPAFGNNLCSKPCNVARAEEWAREVHLSSMLWRPCSGSLCAKRASTKYTNKLHACSSMYNMYYIPASLCKLCLCVVWFVAGDECVLIYLFSLSSHVSLLSWLKKSIYKGYLARNINLEQMNSWYYEIGCIQ